MRKIYFRLLYLGAVFFENRAIGFQKVIRFIYLNFLLRMMRASACVMVSSKIRVAVRHSSQTGEGFRVFLSDLDLSVYINEPSDLELLKIRKHFKFWKRLFPFVGEIEIYSFLEQERMALLLGGAEPFFSYLRNFRKIEWMETAYQNSETEYHRYKALRSIQNCLNKIAPGLRARPRGNTLLISSFLERWILDQQVFNEIDLKMLRQNFETRIFCYYLGRIMSLDSKTNENEYSLSTKAGLLLLSVMPNSTFEDEALSAAVNELRKNAEVRCVWSNLCELEIYIVHAVARAHSEPLPWVSFAIETLSHALTETDSVLR